MHRRVNICATVSLRESWRVSVKGESIDAWYSGKAHASGAILQALTAPDGFPL